MVLQWLAADMLLRLTDVDIGGHQWHPQASIPAKLVSEFERHASQNDSRAHVKLGFLSSQSRLLRIQLRAL